IIGRTKLWFAISGVFLLIGAISLATQGLNKGIDFTGGSQFNFATPTAVSTGSVSSTFSAAGIPDAVVQGVGKSTGGNYTSFQVKSHALAGSVQNKLLTALAGTYGIATHTIDTK